MREIVSTPQKIIAAKICMDFLQTALKNRSSSQPDPTPPPPPYELQCPGDNDLCAGGGWVGQRLLTRVAAIHKSENKFGLHKSENNLADSK